MKIIVIAPGLNYFDVKAIAKCTYVPFQYGLILHDIVYSMAVTER